MCKAWYNMGEVCRVTEAWEVKITHMGGLNDLTIRESDVEWVVCFALIVDRHIGHEEVCSGVGVSDGFGGTECNVDGVDDGSSGGGGS
jgi:hypothetical protein